MNAKYLLLTSFMVLSVFRSVAQSVISTDRADYFTLPGVPLSVTVGLDIPPAAGLFSYGVKLTYDPTLGPLMTDTSGIQVPSELNFNGVSGAPAVKAIGLGFAAVKGTVDLFANPAQPYPQSRLATFELTFSTPGNYVLGLELFNTLGPTENIFVDGSGATLDGGLRLQGASVHVVPEPNSMLLLTAGVIALFRFRKPPG